MAGDAMALDLYDAQISQAVGYAFTTVKFNCLCTLWTYFQPSVALSVCISKFGQAVTVFFNCLSLDKEEIIGLFPK